jgi:hypothetical protein
MEVATRVLTLLAIVAGVGAIAFAFGCWAYADAVGWRAFARRNPPRAPSGKRYRVETLVFGDRGWYLPAMDLEVGPQGIGLRPIFPFRLFFAPAQIAPEAVAGADRKRTAFFELLRIKVGRNPTDIVGIPPCEALDAIQSRLRVPIGSAP